MPGRGPSPRPPAQRRRRNAPARGEWLELTPLKKPVLPTLRRRPARDGAWSTRTRSTWAAWRKDPVTGIYGPAEIAAAINLAWLFEEHVRNGGAKLATEVRLQMDGLGLTLKGKRELRIRLVDEIEQPADEVAAARQRRERTIRAVDPRA